MSFKRVSLHEFGGPGVLRVETVEDLPEPQPSEVRVRVLACSAAYTDTLIRRGIYPDVKQPPPITPGYDMIGIVDKSGEGVTAVTDGDKVAALTITGAYSEFMVLRASQVVKVPAGLDNVQAVSLILSYVTAFQMLTRLANVQAGESILVHGAGGAVGNALVQLGTALKLNVYGTASESNHDALRAMGCHPIDYRNEDFVIAIAKYEPDGVNAVFDAMGGDHLKRSLKATQRHGTLVAYGSYNATSSRALIMDFLRVQFWGLLPWMPSTAFYSISAWHEKHHDWFEEDLKTLFQWLADGRIRPQISQTMRLEEASKAHELLDTGQAKGKIVLLPNVRFATRASSEVS